MSALAVEHEPGDGRSWDELVRIWEQTDAPESGKVEIIEGIVTMSPSPSGDHGTTVAVLQRQLYTTIPEDWELYQNLGLLAPQSKGVYIPDLAVLPKAMVTGRPHAAAADALLLVEVTSRGNANHDRVKKLRGYAIAGVPLYLLLDPWHSDKPTAVLYGEPENGTYRTLQVVEYGEKLTLPAPFDLTIDTGAFPAN